MNNFKLILIILLTIGFEELTSAQNVRNVGGIVRDSKENVPLEYCTIVLMNHNDSSLVKGIVTDINGHFLFKNINEGKYILRASQVGYTPIYQNIVVNNDMVLNFSLVQSIKEINGVTVTAKRIEYKYNKYIINMINNPIAKGKDVIQTLELMPGVMDVNNVLSVNGNEVAEVYIDGRLINDKDELKGLQATDISKLEIVPDEGKRMNAATTSGKAVIRIYMKKLASGGFYGNASAYTSIGKKQDGESLSIPFYYRKGKLNLYNYINANHWNSPYIRNMETDYKQTSEMLMTHAEDGYKKKGISEIFSCVYDMTDEQSIGVTFNTIQKWAHESTDSHTERKNTSDFVSDYHLHGKRNVPQYQATLNYNILLDKKGSDFHFVADYLNNQNDYNDHRISIYPDASLNDSLLNTTNIHTNQWKMTADVDLKKWKRGTLSFGGNYYDNRMSYIICYQQRENAQWEQNENLSDHFRYEGSGLGFYVDYTQMWKKLTLDLSTRLQNDKIIIHSKDDYSKRRNLWNLLPEINIDYSFNKEKDCRLTFYAKRRMNTIRYVDMNPVRVYISDIYYQKGNPDLDPVKGYFTGFDFQINSNLQLSYGYGFSSNDVALITSKDPLETGVTYQMPVNTGRSYSHSIQINYNRTFFKCWTTNTFLQGSINYQPYNDLRGKTQRLLFLCDNNFRITSNAGIMLNLYWEKGMQFVETHYHNVYNAILSYYQNFLKDRLCLQISSQCLFYRNRILTTENEIYWQREANDSRKDYFSINLSWKFRGGKKVEAKRAKSILEMQETTIGQH